MWGWSNGLTHRKNAWQAEILSPLAHKSPTCITRIKKTKKKFALVYIGYFLYRRTHQHLQSGSPRISGWRQPATSGLSNSWGSKLWKLWTLLMWQFLRNDFRELTIERPWGKAVEGRPLRSTLAISNWKSHSDPS